MGKAVKGIETKKQANVMNCRPTENMEPSGVYCFYLFHTSQLPLKENFQGPLKQG